jgi:predicted Zn-dependent peptidase
MTARNAAIAQAEALFRAAGRADRIAREATAPFDPPRENLRYLLLLYAAATRDPLLQPACLAERRHRARSAIRAYRTLRDRGAPRGIRRAAA